MDKAENNGWTPLYIATEKLKGGLFLASSVLAKAGKPPPLALWKAAEAGNAAEVDRLLTAGADKNEVCGARTWPPI